MVKLKLIRKKKIKNQQQQQQHHQGGGGRNKHIVRVILMFDIYITVSRNITYS